MNEWACSLQSLCLMNNIRTTWGLEQAICFQRGGGPFRLFKFDNFFVFLCIFCGSAFPGYAVVCVSLCLCVCIIVLGFGGLSKQHPVVIKGVPDFTHTGRDAKVWQLIMGVWGKYPFDTFIPVGGLITSITIDCNCYSSAVHRVKCPKELSALKLSLSHIKLPLVKWAWNAKP